MQPGKERTMRKQTHLKKVVSLAVAAAMAVSVCTTALAEETTPDAADVVEVTEQVDDENDQGNEAEPEETVETESEANAEEKTDETQESETDAEETPSAPETELQTQPENQVATQNANGQIAVYADDTVATLGETSYSDIDDALDKWCEQGGKLTLTSDCESVRGGRNFTKQGAELDLNGCTLKRTSTTPLMFVKENASITVTNGTIENCSQFSAVLNATAGGAVTLQKTKITGTIGYAAFVTGTLKIEQGSEIIQITMYPDSTVDLTEGALDKVAMRGGTLNVGIKDDKEHSKVSLGDISTYASGGVVNLYSGIVDKISSAQSVYSQATVNFAGSIFKEIDPPDGYSVGSTTYNGTTYKTVVKLDETNAAAKIGNKLYGSLLQAASEATANDTIIVLSDYEGNNQDGRVVIKQPNVTLDLNGHTIKNNGYGSTPAVVLNAYSSADTDTFKIINSAIDKEATIESNVPVDASAFTYAITVSIADNVTLKAKDDEFAQVKLGAKARLEDTEYNRKLVTCNNNIKNCLSVTVDGKGYIYGFSISDVAAVADKATMLGDNNQGSSQEIKYAGNNLFTLDLGGHTYYYHDTALTDEGLKGAVYASPSDKGGKLTIANGNIVSDKYGVNILADDYTLTLDNVTVTANYYYGIATNGSPAGTSTGSSANANITLKDSKIINKSGAGIYFPAFNGVLTIENSTVEGQNGIQLCSGTLNISGDKTVITATGADEVENTGNDGNIPDGAAVSVIKRAGYGEIGRVAITGGKFKSANGKAFSAYEWDNTNMARKDWNGETRILISGGDYTSKVDAVYIAANKSCNPLLPPVDGCNFRVGNVPAEGETVKVDPEVKEPVAEVKDKVDADKVTGVDADKVDTAAKNIKIVEDEYIDDVKDAVQQAAADTVNSEKTAQKAVAELEKKKVDLTNETVVIVTVPKLRIKPQAAVSDEKTMTKSMTFEIELVYDVKATTDVTNMTEKNTVMLAENQPVTSAPTMNIVLDDVTALQVPEADAANLYIKHEKDGKLVAYHPIKDVKTNNGIVKSVTFENDKGFSEFTLLYDARKATVVIDGKTVTLTPADIGKTLVHEDKDGYTWNGVQFEGIADSHTTLTDKLLTDLVNASGTVKGTSTYTKNAEDTKPSPEPTAPTPAEPSPAPTTAPTAAPAAESTATATPAPTAAPAASGAGYYTCKACGYHDWTATSEGYKCNHCGYVESVKQLSGYKNVKGVYEPKTSTAKEAKTTATIPQTSDEMPIVPIAIIAVAALLGLGVTVVLKKKNKQ